jgi:hypothetical protein
VQTFAGLGEIDFSRYWHSLPARSAEGLNSRDFLALGRTAANTLKT